MIVITPSTGCGVYHTHRMKRLSGQGISGLLGDVIGNDKASKLLKIKSQIGEQGILGKGTGSFLLDGGMGGQNSYPSISQYTAETGRVIRRGGGFKGLEKLSSKLGNLNIKAKKHNIKFEM